MTSTDKNKEPLLPVAFLTLIVSLLLPNLFFAYPDGWSDDIQISPYDGKGRGTPDIAADTFNDLWIVCDTVTWVSGTGEILYSKHDSIGNCLIAETTVSNNPTYSIHPRTVSDASGNIHFIWRDETPQGLGLWHAKLASDGTVLVPAHMSVSGGGGFGISTEIALDKYQRINIAWEEAPSGYSQMSYTKLDSLGNPLLAKIRVTPEDSSAYWVGIGVDSFANSHLACRTDSHTSLDRLTYSKIDTSGSIIVANRVLAIGMSPSILCDTHQNVHLVYYNPAGPGSRIDYLKLDNEGNICVGPTTVSSGATYSNRDPHMAIDSRQCLHVVWSGTATDSTYIWYCKLDTMGEYLEAPMKIVYPYEAGAPRVAVDGNDRLHVVWIDVRLGPEGYIFYKRGENEQSIKEGDRLQVAASLTIGLSPNPFSHNVRITYPPLQALKNTKLEIYNVTGMLLKQWNCATIQSSNCVVWDGTDNTEQDLPSGVYFVRLRTNKFQAQEKVLLVR